MFENLRRTKSSYARYPETPPYEYSQYLRLTSRRESYRDQEPPKDERAPSPAPQPLQKRLTTALLDATPESFRSATEHPFLEAAGQGEISKHDLSRWLSQDRLYAETYISFVSSLIARVSTPFTYISDKSSSLRWRIIHSLTGCLQNIHRELEFFSDTAKKYDLQLDLPFYTGTFGPNPITEQYLALFSSFHSDPDHTLLEGLIVLWATEKCYLEAWTFASSHSSSSISPSEDADGGALRADFIPNWSSEDFRGFVQDLADITDELAAREGALKKIEVFKALWLHVLDIERGFWPEIGDA